MIRVGGADSFITETMNEADFTERDGYGIVLSPDVEPVFDDINTAVLFKKRSIAIISKLFPATEIVPLEWAALRLEIQTGRAYRLHAHRLARTVKGRENVLKVVTAASRDLRGAVRDA